MKELTVIELSEQTGLTRSQIYYLNKKHNLINSNEKINYKYALPIIAASTIKKAKRANEKNFSQILNMLILQNTALQKQLDLASEREKDYLSELTSFRQNLTQKPTLTPPIDQSNVQSELENDLNNIGENSQNLIKSENEKCAPNESRNGSNIETESINKTYTQPHPTTSFTNKIILSKSDTSDDESSRQQNEVIEKKENPLFNTSSPTQGDTKRLLNFKRTTTATIVARIPKTISVTINRKLNPNKQSGWASRNKSIADQDDLNRKDNLDE